MTLFKYSFPLTPPPETRREYAHSEFMLELPSRWRQLPAEDDGTLSFISDVDDAAIVISADFHELPDDQAQDVAEKTISSRIEVMEKASGGTPVQVLHRAIRPHADGVSLEMSFAAESDHVHLYLGYVTPRKVLSFSMVCQPGKQEAATLFNATVPGFRPRLP